MAMIFTPLEVIFDQMGRGKLRYWALRDSDKVLLAECVQTDYTVEDSYNKLKQVIDQLDGDYVILTLRATLPNKSEESGEYAKGEGLGANKKFVYRIKLAGYQGAVGGMGINGMGGGGMGGINQGIFGMILEMNKQNAQLSNELQMLPLKMELERLKEDRPKNNGYVDQLINAIAEKGVIAIRESMFDIKKPAGAPVAAHTEPVEELTEELKRTKEAQLNEDLKTVAQFTGAKGYDFYRGLAKFIKESPDQAKPLAQQIIDNAA